MCNARLTSAARAVLIVSATHEGICALEQNKDGKSQRVAAAFTAAELDAIDAWGFARRMRNRSDVIRELVRHGIAATEKEPSAAR